VTTSEPKVFISYRRQETAGHAGRLYDAMSARFGEANVFVDVDQVPGIDFVERITEAVSACRVLLVVMGPRWARLPHGESGLRIADPDDFVRLEVETALRRPEVTVIPVLVGGAEMPDPYDLPQDLRAITQQSALELSDTRWHHDVDCLLARLEHTPGVRARFPQSSQRRKLRERLSGRLRSPRFPRQ
jgi:TIR domain